MSRIMTQRDERSEPWLPDEDIWDNPARLSAADLYMHAGTGRRGGGAVIEDPEDGR